MKPVTFHEQKILKLIAQGYTSQEIALAYGISTHTVQSHRKNLLIKLDAKNVAELILKAVKANVLPIDNPNHNENLDKTRHENEQ